MIVADAHVHVHDCYPPDRFFDDTWANLAAAAQPAATAGGQRAFQGVVCLTETAGDDAFGRFAACARSGDHFGGWSFAPTADACALRASRDDRSLFVLAGRQVAAQEDLEVLAIGTTARRADGGPIRDVLAWARAQDALPVVPWGPGKWLFARDALLRALIDESRGAELYLGDESSRPVFWGEPRPFAFARTRGVRNLPGTDPLPFPSERARAGRYGFRIDAALDPERPATSLKRLVRDPATALHAFGRRETPLRFVRNQIAMQLRKRRRAAAHG
jgi:hypothetical protein